MKKAFTMIELIFVIVILGILAAVAIPKLNATRDDAELAKANTNLTTLMSDIYSYYTSKGDIPASGFNLQSLTGVELWNNPTTPAQSINAAFMGVKDKKDCLYVEIKKNTNKENYIALRRNKDIKSGSLCEKFLDQAEASGIVGQGYSDSNFTTAKSTLDTSNTFLRLGGSGVLW
ncbi:prepilin-type N-terminal cleavage/methylation domain-containing protein [Campylobacter sp. 2018MI13]|uniref:type II secretion system protein n=1 Tax=Campylobacter sp. 2018MI13 TaxID=2836737 RepID=UPI0020256A68|nr:prepilin-type N-terminal cleavage/methylation domain-containing protein [Campylobacter sp. 2018MI13]